MQTKSKYYQQYPNRESNNVKEKFGKLFEGLIVSIEHGVVETEFFIRTGIHEINWVLYNLSCDEKTLNNVLQNI